MTTSSILVLEDELLIAMDLEDLLLGANYKDVTIVSSIDAAKLYFAAKTPSLTILDVHLRDGDSVEIAKLLFSRDVPFVVMSGSERGDVDDVFQDCPWIAKPFETQQVLSVVTASLERNRTQRGEDRRSASAD